MKNYYRVTNYQDLLTIRRSARRRDATIMGAIFLLSLISTIGIGLVSGLGDREVYLVTAMNVVFGIAFVMAWVRLEIIQGVIDLLNNL